MPRKAALLLFFALLGAVSAGVASAQPSAQTPPLVDVAEVFGVLDSQFAADLVARVHRANEDGAALLVVELDSAGALEVDAGPILDAVAASRVPVAVWIGPRRAEARSAAALLAMGAHVAAIGPSGRLGPLHPTELTVDPDTAAGRAARVAELALARSLAASRGRGDPVAILDDSLGANASLDARLIDVVVPSVPELLNRLDGRTVRTAAGSVTLDLKSDEVVPRLFRPGPIRGFLHTLATTPALVYVLLLAGAMLVAFEVFQPGFGIAGVSGVAVLAAAGYGMTVLPVGILGVVLFCLGSGLLIVDVALNELGPATAGGTALLAYGSLTMFPAPADALGVPGWLVGVGVVSSLVFFVPVMTFVRRSRRDPETQKAARALIGLPGQVRSILNPEGFVWVADALWRARSEDGTRLRVGEDVVVTGTEGAMLRVRRP